MLRVKENKNITIFLILSLILGMGSCGKFGDALNKIQEWSFFKSTSVRIIGTLMGLSIFSYFGYRAYKRTKK